MVEPSGQPGERGASWTMGGTIESPVRSVAPRCRGPDRTVVNDGIGIDLAFTWVFNLVLTGSTAHMPEIYGARSLWELEAAAYKQ